MMTQLKDALERLRPEVRAFALLMEGQLAKHDYRPGWKHEDIDYPAAGGE